ncbi:MAG: YwiC-like family protein [Cellulomonas sp.]
MPNQHGAWAMLVLPPAVGAIASGIAWSHLLLLAAWMVGYLAFFAAGLWLRSRRRPRYWPPVRTYTIAAVALAVVLLAVHPELAWWAPVFAPLLAASLWFSARRADRSLANDAVTVVAASLMTVVAWGLGAAGGTTGGGLFARLPGATAPHAWLLAGVLFAYFAGTVLYVKTMIRERGNRRMWWVSVGYHAAIVVPTAWVEPSLGALFAVLAIRAALVPRRWPTLSPRAVGVGEVVASVALGVLLLTL